MVHAFISHTRDAGSAHLILFDFINVITLGEGDKLWASRFVAINRVSRIVSSRTSFRNVGILFSCDPFRI